MPLTRLDRQGTWSDFAGDVWVRAAGQTLTAERIQPDGSLTLLWTVAVPEPLMFIRSAVAPDGTIITVGKGNLSGLAMWVLGAGVASLGISHGNNCVAIRHDGTRFLATFIEGLPWPPHIITRNLSNGDTVGDVPLPAVDGQYSSQGIVDLAEDGTVLLLDEHRSELVSGWTLTKPNRRGLVVVGQTDPAAIRVGITQAQFSHRVVTALAGLGDDPHVAVLPNGRIAVCAYTPIGASLALLDLPYPPGEWAPGTGPQHLPGPILVGHPEPRTANPEPRSHTMSDGRPTLDQWATVELPALIEAKAGYLGLPDWGQELLRNDGDLLKVVTIWCTRRYGINERQQSLSEMVRYERDPEGLNTPTPGTSVVAGRIRIDGRRFVNDAGRFHPIFATGFALAEQVAHGREADAIRYLDWASRAGFNGVRVLAMCDGLFKLSPADGLAALPRLLALARERGLYAEVVALADTAQLRVDLRAQVGNVAAAVAGADNALLQVANEHYHSTQASELHDVGYLKSLATAIPAGLIYTLSAGESDEGDEPQGMYATRHLDRGRDKWNQVRRVRELEDVSNRIKKPLWNDEPIGADEVEQLGRRMADPEFFFAMGVLNRIFEVGGTFHFQDGLQAQVPRPGQQRCAEAFVAGATVIPSDVDLVFKNSGWADSPVKSAAFERTVVRVYSGIAGGRGWSVVVGKSGDPAIEWQGGWKPVATLVDRGPVAVLEITR